MTLAVLEVLERRQLLAAHILGNSAVFSTIQAAVDAATRGATIMVDPGTYSETVRIDKSLTLLGNEAGIDARSSLRVAASETIVNGALNADGTRSSAFYVAANDVTIDGFTVQGETSQSVTAGAGIVLGPAISGAHILNNIIQNNVAGLFLSNNRAADPAVIYHNVFRDNNNPGSNGGRGIYSDGGITGGILTNVIIDSNAFFRNYGSTGTTTKEAAISFEAVATLQTNIRISNNVFDSNGKGMLIIHASNIAILNNTVTYSTDRASGALRFEGDTHDVVIRDNTLFRNTCPAIRIDSKDVTGGENYNFSINQNNLYFNGLSTAISVTAGQYTGSLDATNNWYGNATGPSGDGPGTGNAVFAYGNSVTFSPWATTPFPMPTSAYLGAPASIDQTIQAENFDQGGEGYAYHDSDSINTGDAQSYRRPNSVDLANCGDVGGGYNITDASAGEWVNYTVSIQRGGTYDLAVRVASDGQGGTFHFEVDGVPIGAAMTIPDTGGSQTYTTINQSGIILPAGVHTLRLVNDAVGPNGVVGNYNWFRFTYRAAVPAAPARLVASTEGINAISLSWQDNSRNETAFVVERRTGIDGVWQPIQTLAANTTSWTDITASGGNLYFYRVSAINGAGQSIYSNEASASVPAVASVMYLSDLPFATATSGWGQVQRDKSVGGNAITLNGVSYARGLGVNAVSDITVNLNGAFNTFVSDIGVDDETGNGSVVFQVYADGVKIFDSGIRYQNSPTQTVTLNIAGVQQLRLHVDDAGDGIDSDHADWAGARVLAVPAAPSGLNAAAANSSQINLTWTDNSDNETGFKIERSLDGSSWRQIALTNADVTSYVDSSGLSANTRYYYRIRAVNSGGDSEYSNAASTTTLGVSALPAGWSDTDLGAVSLAGGATYANGTFIMITGGTDIWSSADTEHFTYQLLSGDGTFIAQVAGMQNTDSWAKAGIQMRNSLAANAMEASAVVTPVNGVVMTYRDTKGATTNGLFQTGAAPVWLKLVRSGDTFTSYRSDNGLMWTLIGSKTIKMGQKIYVGLVGVSKNTRATNTEEFNHVSIIPAVPATTLFVPSNLMASAGALASAPMNLTWTNNLDDEMALKIKRSPDGPTGWGHIGTMPAKQTTYSDKGLSENIAKSQRVPATSAAGDSGHSQVAAPTTRATLQPPAAPSGLGVAALNSSQVKLTWSEVSRATGYKIERSLDGSSWRQIALTGANVTSYTDSTRLTAGTRFYYRVRATNVGGNSGYSNVASATTPKVKALQAGTLGLHSYRFTFAHGLGALISGSVLISLGCWFAFNLSEQNIKRLKHWLILGAILAGGVLLWIV